MIRRLIEKYRIRADYEILGVLSVRQDGADLWEIADELGRHPQSLHPALERLLDGRVIRSWLADDRQPRRRMYAPVCRCFSDGAS